MKKNNGGLFMHEFDDILKEMDSILNQLVQNAQKLQEVSRQVTSEDELSPLQKKQEELLEKLMSADKKYKAAVKGQVKDVDSPIRKRISEKLATFEKLNASFIENLSASHGLIQFEIHKRKRQDKK